MTVFIVGCSDDPDGTITMGGLCMPSPDWKCFCSNLPPQKPPPPSPPPSPPSPPSYPPRPPIAPVECVTAAGRTNALASATPKYCWQLNVGTPGGCSSYFTQAANKRVRLCFNPIHPTIAPGVECKASDEYVLCDLPPPRPPAQPPAPPAFRRQLL